MVRCAFKYCTAKFTRFCVSKYFIVIFASGTVISDKKSCAYFEFDNPPLRSGEVLSLEENTTLEIRFQLKNKSCINLQSFFINIERFDENIRDYTPQCKILQEAGSCWGSDNDNQKCTCETPVNSYAFWKLVRREDSRKWRWSVEEDLAEDFVISLNNESPPKIVAEFQHIRSAVAGHNTNVSFLVYTHTSNMTDCKLSRCQRLVSTNESPFPNHRKTSYSCNVQGKSLPLKGVLILNASLGFEQPKCQCSINSKVSGLTFTIEIFDVMQEDEGKWCVTTYNQEGRRQMDLFLMVDENNTTREHTPVQTVMVAVPVAIGTVLLFNAVICALYIRKNRKKNSQVLIGFQQSLSVQPKSESEATLTNSSSVSPFDDGILPVQHTIMGAEGVESIQRLTQFQDSVEESSVRFKCQDADIMEAIRLLERNPDNPIIAQSVHSGGAYYLNPSVYSALNPRTKESNYYLTPCIPPSWTSAPSLSLADTSKDTKQTMSMTGDATATITGEISLQKRETHYDTDDHQYVTII